VANGGRYDVSEVHLWTFRAGKVTSLRGYVDMAILAAFVESPPASAGVREGPAAGHQCRRPTRCVRRKPERPRTRSCAPPTSGGAAGYQWLLDALADPSSPDHEDAVDRLDADFDPVRR
jgi:hypothetical protein